MIEARKHSCDDHGFVDLRLRRSFDGGKTWTPSLLIYSNSTETVWTTVGDGNWVQDAVTGIITLFHTRNNTELFLSNSTDDGASWSEPISVPFLKTAGESVGTGHAGGIQLSAGPTKGRLIVPLYSGGPYAIYSDDGGRTWRRGARIPGETYVDGSSAGEWAVAETGAFTKDGVPILLATVRNSPNIPSPITGKGFRLQVSLLLPMYPLKEPDFALTGPIHLHLTTMQSYSTDSGETWSQSREVKALPEPIRGCEGALIFHRGTRKLYFSHPDPDADLLRNRLKVWSSSNHGETWQDHAVVWNKAAGYSSLTIMSNGELGVFYDRNNHSMAIFEAASVSWTTISS